jgi:hypothetical protein
LSAHSSLECFEVLTIGGVRMVEEEGELELGDDYLERSSRSPAMMENE